MSVSLLQLECGILLVGSGVHPHSSQLEVLLGEIMEICGWEARLVKVGDRG